jgi:hypothetical protein
MIDERLTSLSVVYLLSIVAGAFSASPLQRKAPFLYGTMRYNAVQCGTVKDMHSLVVPFQPHVADLETVVGWFLSINQELQSRVVFVPNRLTPTKEQRDGLQELRNIIKDEGRGHLAPGLSNRPAVYPPLLNGRKENFFRLVLDVKVKQEIEAVFASITQN